LLAPLGGQPAVWTECLFANPIADIAVLGSPDDQELCNEAEAYNGLVESATPLLIADALEKGHGWLLSLDCQWFRCAVQWMDDGPLWISQTAQRIVRGMSGSPIISDQGEAIGVICAGNDTDAESSGWTSPRLVRDLPVWLLQAQPTHK
jgi:hypothetical protein